MFSFISADLFALPPPKPLPFPTDFMSTHSIPCHALQNLAYPHAPVPPPQYATAIRSFQVSCGEIAEFIRGGQCRPPPGKSRDYLTTH